MKVTKDALDLVVAQTKARFNAVAVAMNATDAEQRVAKHVAGLAQDVAVALLPDSARLAGIDMGTALARSRLLRLVGAAFDAASQTVADYAEGSAS